MEQVPEVDNRCGRCCAASSAASKTGESGPVWFGLVLVACCVFVAMFVIIFLFPMLTFSCLPGWPPILFPSPLPPPQPLPSSECPVADDIISRDIGRTFPDHPQFRDPAGQAALWRVLHAYATTDPEVGSGRGGGWVLGVYVCVCCAHRYSRAWCLCVCVCLQ